METATELETTVKHVGGMLRTVRDLSRSTNPSRCRVAEALLAHLNGLTLADLGLDDEPTSNATEHPGHPAAA